MGAGASVEINKSITITHYSAFEAASNIIAETIKKVRNSHQSIN